MKIVSFTTRGLTYNLIVDEIDYWSVLATFKTTGFLTETGEVKVCVNGQNYSLANWLLGKPPTGYVIDHINRDKFDFRRENLRVVTHTVNVRNRGMFKNNRSGYKGVHLHHGKYDAQLCVGIKRYYSCGHTDVVEAAYAYDAMVQKHSPESTTNQSLGLIPLKLSTTPPVVK